MLTPNQIRGARAVLGLNQAALAKLAGLSATALNSIESGQSDPKVSTMDAIRRALEATGARFEKGMVGLRPFQVGDRVKYRSGKVPNENPLVWHIAGEITGVQTSSGPGGVPQLRVRFDRSETDWTPQDDFEFALPPDPGFQRAVR